MTYYLVLVLVLVLVLGVIVFSILAFKAGWIAGYKHLEGMIYDGTAPLKLPFKLVRIEPKKDEKPVRWEDGAE